MIGMKFVISIVNIIKSGWNNVKRQEKTDYIQKNCSNISKMLINDLQEHLTLKFTKRAGLQTKGGYTEC